jgi:hypothetical protein
LYFVVLYYDVLFFFFFTIVSFVIYGHYMFEIPALCALLALVRPLSIGLILYIYRERDRFVVGRVWGGGIRHLARFPLVCSALSPPVKLKSVE